MNESPASAEAALELFFARRGSGEALDPVAFAASYPHFEPELSQAIEAMLAIDRATNPTHGADAPLPERIGAFRIVREIGRGGMGVVLEAVEEPLQRHVALKVLPPELLSSSAARRRFRREAELAARLDHPGIATIYGAGVEDEQPWIAMRYVAGETLAQLILRARARHAACVDPVQSDAGGRQAALSVAACLARVARALQFAHEQGVLHRDVKPSNIIVTRDGAPVLLDFGLAITEEPDGRSLTRTNEPVGTPAYLAPECVGGELARPDAQCDVYALGVTLHECLTLHRPFDAPTRAALYRAILSGPPPDPREQNRAVPRDLAIVAATALEPDRSRRYRSAAALASDLEACAEGRPIAARAVPLHGRLARWVRREPRLAATSFAVVATAIGALAWVSIVQSNARQSIARQNKDLVAATERAASNERLATRRAADVFALSAIQDLQDLVQRADDLWPALPEKIPELEAWQRDARALLDGEPAEETRGIRGRPALADHRRQLAELESHASPEPARDGKSANRASNGPAAALAPAAAAADAEPHREWKFATSDERWWHTQLTKLIADLEAFADRDTGLAGPGVNPEHGWGIEKRLASARTIDELSLHGSDARERWNGAIASIRDRSQCPAYAGLEITAQVGLIPIGRDASSGLWEFAHLETGAPAVRGTDGKLAMAEGMGLVFVLIPGGRFWMGAQSTDQDGHNYDPGAGSNESPVRQVELAAFFLSKYEMTQDQWLRFTGTSPSFYRPGDSPGGKTVTRLHPVERVSWNEAMRVLQRVGLTLPTEAQWEYADRAGTGTVWWTGSDKSSLQGAANLSDKFAKLHGGANGFYEEGLDDGYTVHAPIGSFRANAFGLHDTIGNVWELCRDAYGEYDAPVRPGDGERQTKAPVSHMIRGASFFAASSSARSAKRNDVSPDYKDFNLGIRPARMITPP
jgi:serine/threonine protein kinase/formylglycine-generating enzyme required for sulfatase activity